MQYTVNVRMYVHARFAVSAITFTETQRGMHGILSAMLLLLLLLNIALHEN